MSATFALFIVFLVLKLTHVIAWSWWWVTCPLWIGLAILLGIFIFTILLAGGAISGITLVKKLRRK